MKRKIAIIVSALLITCCAAAYAGEVLDKILVVVNDEAVTRREVDRLLEPIFMQYRTLYSGDELLTRMEEARKQVIAQLIDDKLILCEAKKLNVEAPEKDIEYRIADAQRRFGSEHEFEQALATQGLTLDDLRKRYREQIMIHRLIDARVGSKVSVSPAEISAYYTGHIDQFIQPETLTLRNILIKTAAYGTPEKALEKANEILRRLHEGGDFAALAKEYSQGPFAQEGGLMQKVKRGDLLPEIENVVFNMREGDISGVVQTALGYHIFRLEDRQSRRPKELPEVRHEIEETIFREKVESRLKDMVERLKKNAYIAFK